MWIKASLCPAVAALLLVACSSSSAPKGPKANVPQPQFRIDQVFGPAEANFPEGMPPLFSRLVDTIRADEAVFVFEDERRQLEGDAAMLSLFSPVFWARPIRSAQCIYVSYYIRWPWHKCRVS